MVRGDFQLVFGLIRQITLQRRGLNEQHSSVSLEVGSAVTLQQMSIYHVVYLGKSHLANTHLATLAS